MGVQSLSSYANCAYTTYYQVGSVDMNKKQQFNRFMTDKGREDSKKVDRLTHIGFDFDTSSCRGNLAKEICSKRICFIRCTQHNS